VIAWRLDGAADTGDGYAGPRQACTDGDARCDRDGAADGRCVFHLWLCANTTEPADLPCRPGTGRDGVGTVAIAEVRRPTTQQATQRKVDTENYNRLLTAAAAAPVGSNADVCGPRLEIRVPVRAGGQQGSRAIKVRATTNRNARDADSMKLVCLRARDQVTRPRRAPAPAPAASPGTSPAASPGVSQSPRTLIEK
jgi:hypothetical protein